VSAPVVVLVGPPGAGKTTVGEVLATRLGVAFRDTDRDVEAVTSRSIADIFIDDGEDAFRALEREAVVVALRDHDGVLALGGGAVAGQETRNRLVGQRVVFLDVGLAAAAERTGMSTARPLLAVNPRATLKAMLDARRPLYIEVATDTVSTDAATVAEVVDRIAALL
jgi:shikimate kinase